MSTKPKVSTLKGQEGYSNICTIHFFSFSISLAEDKVLEYVKRVFFFFTIGTFRSRLTLIDEPPIWSR